MEGEGGKRVEGEGGKRVEGGGGRERGERERGEGGGVTITAHSTSTPHQHTLMRSLTLSNLAYCVPCKRRIRYRHLPHSSPAHTHTHMRTHMYLCGVPETKRLAVTQGIHKLMRRSKEAELSLQRSWTVDQPHMHADTHADTHADRHADTHADTHTHESVHVHTQGHTLQFQRT